MRFGVGHLADVLAGNDNEKVRSFGHDRLSVFGIADAESLRWCGPWRGR
jgi:ATP-dependent DNA helicase RecQ